MIMVDFLILVGTFALCEKDGGFDTKADFNEDGCVNIVDCSLLISNLVLVVIVKQLSSRFF